MNFPFYDSLEEITINGKTHKLELSFGYVLRYFDLRRNPEGLSDKDIVEVALSWFLPTVEYNTVGEDTAAKIIAYIEEDYIDIKKRKIASKKPQPKVVDFTYDSGYIYAAFMQVYGIDLYEAAYELNWRKFIYMFESLPEDTAISQIMRIRAKDIDPKATSEEIQRLSELKVIYALPNDGGTNSETGQMTLNGLFNYLYAKAKAGERVG